MQALIIPVSRLSHLAELPLPSHATLQSAGLDLLAAIDADKVIQPLQRMLIPTGIAIALPEGFEAQIRPRSGLAIKHGITVLNAPGTIDADYRGEIFVALINFGTENFTIIRGMKIAQMVIAQYSVINWNILTNLDDTHRGAGGFGSTGV